jgi:hypothetical protein
MRSASERGSELGICKVRAWKCLEGSRYRRTTGTSSNRPWSSIDREARASAWRESQPSLCNPIAQASTLNRAGTDMNVIMGLCVGHDMLFVKHADAPTTTLVAKERVTGHNPVAALYGNHFNCKRLAKQPVTCPRDP